MSSRMSSQHFKVFCACVVCLSFRSKRSINDVFNILRSPNYRKKKKINSIKSTSKDNDLRKRNEFFSNIKWRGIGIDVSTDRSTVKHW